MPHPASIRAGNVIVPQLSEQVFAEEKTYKRSRIAVIGVPFTGGSQHEIIDETQEGTDNRSNNLGNTHQRMMLQTSNLNIIEVKDDKPP